MRIPDRIYTAVILLFMAAVLFVGCSQENEPPVARSITVSVADAADGKTIGPMGNVDVSHYIISITNGDLVQTSGMLTKGFSFTVTNIPVGTWTAKVEGYVENGSAADGYVLVSTGESQPFEVGVGSDTSISVTLDTLVESLSGDVAVTALLPSQMPVGSTVYATWSLTGAAAFSLGWEDALALEVGEGNTVSFTLDADNLLGGGEQLMQGGYVLSVTVADSADPSAQNIVVRSAEVLRLVAGLPAEGVINLSSSDTGDGGVTVTGQTGDGLVLGQTGVAVMEDVVSITLGYNGIPLDSEMIVSVDDAAITTDDAQDVWYEVSDIQSGRIFTIYGMEEGDHDVTFSVTLSDGSSESISLKVQAISSIFTFSLNGDGQSYTVEGLKQPAGEFVMPGSSVLEIPATYQGKPVTEIGYAAFRGRTDIVGSVVIPDSVISIGENAFMKCSALTSINIPDGLTSIGQWAFNDCFALEAVEISDTSQLESIGDLAFAKCSSLTSINIPDGVTSIRYWTFLGCSSLTSINIPDSVTSIGDSAFSGCSSLTSINIPDSVTSIGESAFIGCSSLTSINIPDSVTSIGEDAFKNCSALTSINIPEGMTTIESGTFWGCTSLTEVTLPSTLETIEGADYQDAGAFGGCTSLESIIIPDGVTSIGAQAFRDCSALTTVEISDASQLESIGDNAFSSCSALTSINIPDGVTSIGDVAFYGCSVLTTVEISDNSQLKSIGNNAFSYCASLTGINIPDGVTTIDNYAFHRCASLLSIDIPDSVTSIGMYAFYICTSLLNINIPDGVTSIGEGAFWSSSFTGIYCEAASQPEGWDASWESGCSADVFWGVLRSEYDAIMNNDSVPYDVAEPVVEYDSVTVTLSCDTSFAHIYYTLDGSEPDRNSTLYTEPFVQTNDATLKVVAYVGNDIYSDVVSMSLSHSGGNMN